MALGAMQALAEWGVRVPADVALIGFDGLEEDVVDHAMLSTVAQPVVDLGREAVAALLRLIEAPAEGPIHRLLPTRLDVRGSCGCSSADAPPDRWQAKGGSAAA